MYMACLPVLLFLVFYLQNISGHILPEQSSNLMGYSSSSKEVLHPLQYTRLRRDLEASSNYPKDRITQVPINKAQLCRSSHKIEESGKSLSLCMPRRKRHALSQILAPLPSFLRHSRSTQAPEPTWCHDNLGNIIPPSHLV